MNYRLADGSRFTLPQIVGEAAGSFRLCVNPQSTLELFVKTFSSGREAKEYLIAQIVLEAGHEGVSLSETERKMMYFSETAWTLPDILEVNEAFDRDYAQAEYEAKMGALIDLARKRERFAGQLKTWNKAVRMLRLEDHYLLVLLDVPPGSSDSMLVDRLKLVGLAVLIVALLVAGVFLFPARG